MTHVSFLIVSPFTIVEKVLSNQTHTVSSWTIGSDNAPHVKLRNKHTQVVLSRVAPCLLYL